MNRVSIGSGNGLSPARRQATTRTNARLLPIGTLGTNFSEIRIEILTFSFKKMRLKISELAAILYKGSWVKTDVDGRSSGWRGRRADKPKRSTDTETGKLQWTLLQNKLIHPNCFFFPKFILSNMIDWLLSEHWIEFHKARFVNLFFKWPVGVTKIKINSWNHIYTWRLRSFSSTKETLQQN